MDTVEWRCDECTRKGSLAVFADDTAEDIARLIEADHAMAAPHCTGQPFTLTPEHRTLNTQSSGAR